MAYFVTGATGLLGRTLLRALLDHRDGEIFVLLPPDGQEGLEALLAAWDPRHRVTAVPGDLAEAALGVDRDWVREHDGRITHFFHLAKVAAPVGEAREAAALEVGSTRNALELAADLDAGCFHHLSSIAASGDYGGFWDETMFDVDQDLPTAYHSAAFESEQVVREESAVPWRVYRTGLVIGDSETGEVDEVDGPYSFFPLLKGLRDLLPPWTPLVSLDLGDTNVVPVDYVAKAMDHLAHLPDRDGEAFHLVNPEPQRTIDVVNAFAEAAGAPRFATPVDRSLTGLVPTRLLPTALRPGTLLRSALRSAPGQLVLRETVGRIGMPPEVVEHLALPATYGSWLTEQALAGSGISVPVLESYAARVWGFWEDELDQPLPGDRGMVAALAGRTVVVIGAATETGRATASQVASAGGVVALVDRDEALLEEQSTAIVARGGAAYAFACVFSDPAAVDALTDRIGAELGRVDFLVVCAGPPPRRSRNALGAVRLAQGLQSRMRDQPGGGHVVHVDGDRVSLTRLTPPSRAVSTATQVADRVVRSLVELAGTLSD